MVKSYPKSIVGVSARSGDCGGTVSSSSMSLRIMSRMDGLFGITLNLA